MATPTQHAALYGDLRAVVLARHLALGRYFRANLISLENHLGELPPDLAQLPEPERAILARWHVVDHERENPLMFGALLQVALAVEHHLGSPTAQHILARNLAAVVSLAPLTGPAAGWVTRWDAATSDRWQLDAEGEPTRCNDFLLDDTGRYQTCIPATDHRHVPFRTRETLRALRARQDADAMMDEALNGFHWAYVDRRRRWEASMDELAGLFAGWAVCDALVPSLRPLIRPPARAVASRLAASGWINVRPCAGFAARGAAGVLPAFELPADRWIRRTGGTGAAGAVDFATVLRQAGYWHVLAGPVARLTAAAVAGSLALPPLLGALGPLGVAIGSMLTIVGAAARPDLLGFVAALALHSDCFDLWRPDGLGEIALGALMAHLPPVLRLEAYLEMLARGGGGFARNFPPYLALIAADDPDTTVADLYVSLIRRVRAAGPPAAAPSPRAESDLDCATATAVAVLLGARELEPTLLAQLDARHDRFVAAGRDEPISNRNSQKIILLLDYLGALALAWLHARRAADSGLPVTTAGFPVPPTAGALADLPGPMVPAIVLQHLPEVRRVVLGRGAGGPHADTPLFSGPTDRDKESAPLAVMPSRPQSLAWAFVYELGRWHGDLPTGIVLQDGDEYEITVTGTVDGLGPEGGGAVDDARWPLHRGLDPAAREGMVLAHIGGYVRVGAGIPRRRYLGWTNSLPLTLRINRPDRAPGGSESFLVRVRLWGAPREVTAMGRVVSCVRRPGTGSGGRSGRQIIGVGGVDPEGRFWFVEAGVAMARIKAHGHRLQVGSRSGPQVIAVGGRPGRRPHLRSMGDGSRQNNLSALPACPA